MGLFLLLLMFFPQEIEAAQENYFVNPLQIYEQFQAEIYNKEYSLQYGFARESTTAYRDAQGSSVGGQVEKFTGLWIVSETESNVQVIYGSQDAYQIGWIDREFYEEEVLFYNGTEKQLLGDGIYKMMSEEKDRSYYLELTFEGDQQYEIRSIKTGGYLDVTYDRDHAVTGLCWADKTGEASQKWQFIRAYDHFYLKNTETGMYLVPKGEKGLGLISLSEEKDSCFIEQEETPEEKSASWYLTRKYEKNVSPYRNFVQYDPDWGKQDYGQVQGEYSGKMAAAGCAAVAMTNMTYALTGQFMDPMTVADFAVEHHYRIIGSGTEDEVFQAAAQELGEAYGFRFVTRCYSTSEMRNFLQKGCVAISYVPGHYVTVADYKEEDKTYLVLDSHPIPRRPTSPYGDWFLKDKLETGGLRSSCYFIFEAR